MVVNKPGVNNTKFEMIFKKDWVQKGEILSAPNNQKIEVLEEPTTHYNKWYYKILNIITFKLFFNVRYTYICRI